MVKRQLNESWMSSVKCQKCGIKGQKLGVKSWGSKVENQGQKLGVKVTNRGVCIMFIFSREYYFQLFIIEKTTSN